MSTLTTFADLGLPAHALNTLTALGYETPSPIQAASIPALLAGSDVLGQAQTGTGKTAAFALPLLSRIDTDKRHTQALVLTPTRELALQVAAAFSRYAQGMRNLEVLSIYGGQAYGGQLKSLRKGPQIVVGTPGRVMDHLRKGTLMLDKLQTLVLDEADEMLRMGFIDDVEWILEQIPAKRQIALFSATMPTVIRKIAQKYLSNPEQVTIKVKTQTADNIRQRYWMVSGTHKLDALTRILEAEEFDGMIIFVRTKTATAELAEKLEARGHSTAAINGDMSQQLRERSINNLKNGKLDILIATDVAARGLDVERITHVVNYDIPYDTESYIHRIGRTGRAGRSGDAILFVSPRERRLLGNIERATKKKVEEMQLPSTEYINNARISRFKQRITDTLATDELSFYTQLIEQYQSEHDIPAHDIAAALAKMAQGTTPLLIKDLPKRSSRKERSDSRPPAHGRGSERNERGGDRKPRRNRDQNSDIKMDLYRIEVGNSHGVKPSNIVGAIANETGIDGNHIARINIEENYSTVELPAGMPKELFQELKKVRVAGQQLNISAMDKALIKKAKSKKRMGGFSRRGKNKSSDS
ncbi:MAG TPA: ATP-dependent RNA helicase [Gammaproteobacteria bacterium]|nr:ATP-dependent RNA helicase [Gammaproteobacteria bacterium]